MSRGIIGARLFLMALFATGTSVFAQEVMIQPEGTLLSQRGESVLFKSLEDIVPVQYAPGGYPGAYPGGDYTPPGTGRGPDGLVYQRPIPDHQVVFSEDPHNRELRSFEGFFIRGEYLNWDLKRPADTMLGESTLLNKAPTSNFAYTDPLDPSISGVGRVSTLEPISQNNMNGARITVGAPLTFGSIEGNAFRFQSTEESFNGGPIDGSGFIPYRLTSVTVANSPADLYHVYTDDYVVNYKTRLYGAEANLIFDGIGGNFLTLKPIAGFRFMNLGEEMSESGNTRGTATPVFHTSIISAAHNNMYVPQAGLRFQWETPWFTFAFDPKVGLGANQYANKVKVTNFQAGDGYSETYDSGFQFMQVVDLGFTGRIPVSEYFTITAGYNFMYLGRVSRAYNNVAYNVTGAGNSDVHTDTRLTDLTIQGLSIGGEITYR